MARSVEAILAEFDDLGFPDVRDAVTDYLKHPHRGFFAALQRDIDAARWNSDDEPAEIEVSIRKAHALVDELRRLLPHASRFGALAQCIDSKLRP